MPLASWHRVAWVICLAACACGRGAPRMAGGMAAGQQAAGRAGGTAADTLYISLSTEDSCWVTDPLDRMGGPVDALTSIPRFRLETAGLGPVATMIHIVGPVPGVYGVRIATGSTDVIVGAEVYCGDLSCEDNVFVERDTTVAGRFVYEEGKGSRPCVVRFLKR
jgi:hypothetical protein